MSEEKRLAGEAAVDSVESGMVIGLGTGSTAYYAIRKLGERVRGGLSIRAIPTSEATRQLAQEEGIALTNFSEVTTLDLTIDGADEVDPHLNLIKGAGGALLREKIVAAASRQVITIADSTKVVPVLGNFPLPVEVTCFGWETVARRILDLGAQANLRQLNGNPFVTDNHQYILDCRFGRIEDPATLEEQLNRIPGVVISGLFVGLTTRALVGRVDTVETHERKV